MAVSATVYRDINEEARGAEAAISTAQRWKEFREDREMVRAFKLYTGADHASHVLEGTIHENDPTDVIAIQGKVCGRYRPGRPTRRRKNLSPAQPSHGPTFSRTRTWSRSERVGSRPRYRETGVTPEGETRCRVVLINS
jgi:hypothetical protein